MGKYLCQDCKNNNNGWCTVRKCNGLKKLNVTICNTFEGENTIEFVNGSKITVIEGNSKSKRAEFKDNTEAYRVLGKREMLWKIQMQVLGLNNDDILNYEEKYRGLVRSIKAIGKHLEFEENLWNAKDIVDSIIDEDMIEASKSITEIL